MYYYSVIRFRVDDLRTFLDKFFFRGKGKTEANLLPCFVTGVEGLERAFQKKQEEEDRKMKTNLVKWAAVLLISARILVGTVSGQAQIIPGGYQPGAFSQYGQMAAVPCGYAPTPYGGYSNQSSFVQTAGFQNTQYTPYGGTTSWGQSQLTGHTLQAGQYGPYGASQFQVSGHSLQYQTGQIYW
jgi:hypothetical protein